MTTKQEIANNVFISHLDRYRTQLRETLGPEEMEAAFRLLQSLTVMDKYCETEQQIDQMITAYLAMHEGSAVILRTLAINGLCTILEGNIEMGRTVLGEEKEGEE